MIYVLSKLPFFFFLFLGSVAGTANKAIHGDGSITSVVSVCCLLTIGAITACHSLCSAPYCLTSLCLAARRTPTHTPLCASAVITLHWSRFIAHALHIFLTCILSVSFLLDCPSLPSPPGTQLG